MKNFSEINKNENKDTRVNFKISSYILKMLKMMAAMEETNMKSLLEEMIVERWKNLDSK